MSDLADQIEAFLDINATGKVSHPTPGLAVELLEKALQHLRSQSLSTQQPMGEPVAWMHPTAGWARTKYHSVLVHCRKDGPKPIPLYALHPNQESGE